MKYKKILGAKSKKKSEKIKEAESKFKWLKEADFADAVIDIRKNELVWKAGTWKDGIWKDGDWKNGIWEDGIWKDGIWEYGIWEDGIWEDGIWKDGVWKAGIWKDGDMWDNLKQCYVKVKWDNKKFVEI